MNNLNFEPRDHKILSTELRRYPRAKQVGQPEYYSELEDYYILGKEFIISLINNNYTDHKYHNSFYKFIEKLNYFLSDKMKGDNVEKTKDRIINYLSQDSRLDGIKSANNIIKLENIEEIENEFNQIIIKIQKEGMDCLAKIETEIDLIAKAVKKLY